MASVPGYITLALAAAYVWYFIRIAKAIKPPGPREAITGSVSRITIIIPFRDEETSLPELLTCMDAQDYRGDWDIILADDHSTDSSSRIASDWAKQKPNATYLRIHAHGKKAAIREAIQLSGSPVIATLDADVRIGPEWLRLAVGGWQQAPTDLLVLPVALDRAKGMPGNLEQMEFLSVCAVTAGSIARQQPLMCNGANLMFSRSAFDSMTREESREDLASGDDMFLLISLARKNPGTVRYCADPGTVALSAAQNRLSLLLKQRIRWASKFRHLQYAPIQLAGTIVGLFHLSLVAMVITDPFSPLLWIAWALKMATDRLLLQRINHLFRIPFRPLLFLLLELLHPWYTVIIPLVGIVWKPSWKGRTIARKAM